MWIKEIVLGVLLQGPLGGNPWVYLVVQKEGGRAILYREGPYKNERVQERIRFVATRLREVGLEQFLAHG